MPLYYFCCEACQTSTRLILSVQQSKEEQKCSSCNTSLIRTPKPPSVQVKETLDNGLMSKKLERFSNAEELYKDRTPPGTVK